MAVTFLVIFAAFFTGCSSGQILEDPPIITSATHQHTLYNGRGQVIEAAASKEGGPAPIITYFSSEADLQADRNGSREAPVEVGNYYVRIRRPAGNGYRAGNDITVEFHIQKALVTIIAEASQEFTYDGNPKAVVYSVDQKVEPGVAYHVVADAAAGVSTAASSPLDGVPVERGLYHAVISYSGDSHHMGSSKTVELVIR